MYEDEHNNLSYENIKQYTEAQVHKLFPVVMGSFTSFPGSLILMSHPGNEVDGLGPCRSLDISNSFLLPLSL